MYNNNIDADLLDTPIYLRAQNGSFLQKKIDSEHGCCCTSAAVRDDQVMKLLPGEFSTIMIHSVYNVANLKVDPAGHVTFGNNEPNMTNVFRTLTGDQEDQVYFIHCVTNKVLECDSDGNARCMDEDLDERKIWTIVRNVEPEKDIIPPDLLNTPVYLQAQNGRLLQREVHSERACCASAITGDYKVMELLPGELNTVMIRSVYNDQNLQVEQSGDCTFPNNVQKMSTVFMTLPADPEHRNKVYLVDCLTKIVLECDSKGYVQCIDEDLHERKIWTIIPSETSPVATSYLSTPVVVLACAAAGVAAVPALGLTAGALVPTAMSTFGTVVPGVGTIHASLAAGGVAATLQASSAAFASTTAATVGGVVGATIGAVFRRNNAENPNNLDNLGARRGMDIEDKVRMDSEDQDGAGAGAGAGDEAGPDGAIASSVAFVSTTAAMVGGFLGATMDAVFSRNNAENPNNMDNLGAPNGMDTTNQSSRPQ
jgi:hypothetical protein